MKKTFVILFLFCSLTAYSQTWSEQRSGFFLVNNEIQVNSSEYLRRYKLFIERVEDGQSQPASSAEERAAGNTLTIWSCIDRFDEMVANYYKPEHPRVKINFSISPYWEFSDKLDPVLASGRGVPDVFTLESDLVRKYVESGLLLDLTDIYEANKSKLLAYPAEIGTYNGRVYALSWQVSPGALFYRRSLAKKYLGTDDPAAVQAYFSSMDKFLETARLLKENSNGRCVVVSSREDLSKLFLALRKQPWIENGKLIIDPAMEQSMDIVKYMYDNRLDGRVGQWSEGWFAGMKDVLRDEQGRLLEVFSYFLPDWGLHYVLKQNAPETAFDWAMIQGPVPYYWGGTWVGAYKNTKNPTLVKEFIRYITTDDGFLERWTISSGDLVSNTTVTNKVKNKFREPFLGGQNHYAAFAEMAQNVNGKLAQGTDLVIEPQFDEARQAFVLGEKTKEQALADFRRQVNSLLGL
jgi:ABC-type glycerol-3-phosphate transport system substrate-binding protein